MRIPQLPPSAHEIFQAATGDTEKLARILGTKATDAQGRYLHWDDLRFKATPDGLSAEEVWCGTKFARNQQLRKTPFTAKDRRPFQFMEPDAVRWQLHWIDRNASGNIAMPMPLDNQAIGKSFHTSSLIEEAFSSSRLEGAATTREVAKAMIREGREPKDKSERMILNNFQAMEFIGRHKHDPLTIEMILELHRIVTEGTLERPEMAGVLRGNADRVVVEDVEGNILHDPPEAKLLQKRLQDLCDFANSPNGGQGATTFIHPVVQAVILHFMIGYDHPFVDGNGRTARALFYWQMCRNGYWLAEYISISKVMVKAPKKYGRAYLETETDANDLTYFLIHQLEVIRQAVTGLIEHLARKAQELSELENKLSAPGHEHDFNYRQFEILKGSLERPGRVFSILDHSRIHRISYQTARNDLLTLVENGFLQKRRMAKSLMFISPPDLPGRIEKYQERARKRAAKLPSPNVSAT